MNRLIACLMPVLALILWIAPVAAQTKVAAPAEKMSLVWPDPTPEELALLPAEGCKALDDIKAPDEQSTPRADYVAWQQTPDGICWAWYKKRFDEAYVYGDLPPADAASTLPPELMTPEQVKGRAERAKTNAALQEANRLYRLQKQSAK